MYARGLNKKLFTIQEIVVGISQRVLVCSAAGQSPIPYLDPNTEHLQLILNNNKTPSKAVRTDVDTGFSCRSNAPTG